MGPHQIEKKPLDHVGLPHVLENLSCYWSSGALLYHSKLCFIVPNNNNSPLELRMEDYGLGLDKTTKHLKQSWNTFLVKHLEHFLERAYFFLRKAIGKAEHKW